MGGKPHPEDRRDKGQAFRPSDLLLLRNHVFWNAARYRLFGELSVILQSKYGVEVDGVQIDNLRGVSTSPRVNSCNVA
jgi:hypothetical protein